jgi:hypothetical protein
VGDPSDPVGYQAGHRPTLILPTDDDTGAISTPLALAVTHTP